MKTLLALLMLPGIFLICVIGASAQLCRLRRLEDWCRHQLTDDQAEEEKDQQP